MRRLLCIMKEQVFSIMHTLFSVVDDTVLTRKIDYTKKGDRFNG